MFDWRRKSCNRASFASVLELSKDNAHQPFKREKVSAGDSAHLLAQELSLLVQNLLYRRSHVYQTFEGLEWHENENLGIFTSSKRLPTGLVSTYCQNMNWRVLLHQQSTKDCKPSISAALSMGLWMPTVSHISRDGTDTIEWSVPQTTVFHSCPTFACLPISLSLPQATYPLAHLLIYPLI